MSPEEEITRGHQAKAFLQNPMFREAYETIESRLVDMLASADISDERGTHLRHLLTAHRKIKGYLEQVIVGGKLAAEQIERERTLKERLLRR